MIIDSHNHVGYQGLDTAGVIAEMDAFNIDVCWLLTWQHPAAEHPGRLDGLDPIHSVNDDSYAGVTLGEIVAARDRYPDRFVLGYCPDPRDSDPAKRFVDAWNVHGVRICGEWSYRMPLDDPRAINLFRKAGELGAPVVLHLDVPFMPNASGSLDYLTGWCGGGAAELRRSLEACPDTTIIGHCPGFWRFISDDEASQTENYTSGPITGRGEVFDLLDTFPNLWADLSANSALSALRRFDDGGRQFIIDYSDRLLYGRDAAGNELQEHLAALKLPDDVRAKLMFENALRLVPVSGPEYPPQISADFRRSESEVE